MKKLALNLDTLSVETFEADPARAARRGTAFGHEATGWRDCEGSSGESCAGGAVDVLMGTCGGSDWTGMDTCEGASCLQTCTFNTCLSCTATQVE